MGLFDFFKKKKKEPSKEVRKQVVSKRPVYGSSMDDGSFSQFSTADTILLATMLHESRSEESVSDLVSESTRSVEFGGGRFGGAGAGSYFDSDYSSSSSSCDSFDSSSDSGSCDGGCD